MGAFRCGPRAQRDQLPHSEPNQPQSQTVEAKGRERRTAIQALGQWSEMRGDRRFASLADIDSEAFDDLRPYLFLISPGETPEDATFADAGEVISGYCDDDLTGRPVAATVPVALWEKWRYCFQAVLEMKKPLANSDRLPAAGGDDILYRGILLPIGDDRDNVTHLLGVFNFKTIHYH